jgi:hypothetical protein
VEPKQKIFYLVLTVAMLIRFFPFGITYFPYLDDYIAYGVTNHLLASGGGPFELYFYYGMYTARPLAGLLDIFVIAPLWGHMWVVLLIFILLHAASLPLMETVFKRCGIPWGKAAAVVFGLYPLLGESVYWVNAASRIVPGFFLLFLSAYGLCKFFDNSSQKGFMVLAVLAGVFSLGFYEQTISFGFALFLLIIYAYRINPFWYAWPFAYAGIAGAYYAVFLQAGRMASRVQEVGFSTGIFHSIGLLLSKEQAYNIFSLTMLELYRINIPVMALCLVSAVLLTLLLKDGVRRDGINFLSEDIQPKGSPFFTAFSVIFLFFAGFGPFFLLRDSFLTLRSLFFCIPSIAIIVQLIWDRPKPPAP